MLKSLPINSLLATLASVYIVQSLIGMFTMQGIPAVLRSEGLSTSQVGLFSLVMLPWVFKFLWAPLVERLRKKGRGYRRHAIVVMSAQIVIALTLALLAGAGKTASLWWFFTSVLTMTLISTVADITADGLAIDNLPKNKRYLGNILQVGGSYIGAVFGGGLFIYLSSLVNWQYALLTLAAIVMLLTLPNLSLFKTKRQHPNDMAHNSPSLLKAISQRQVQLGLLIVAISQLGTRGALAMMMPFLVDQHIDLAQLGLLVAGGGVVTGVLGALLGGWITRNISAYSSLCFFLILEVVLFALFWLYTNQLLNERISLEAIYISHSIVAAAKFVALYTLMMEYAYGEQSGVDFTIFQSMDMFVAIIMSIICGALISQFGYGFHFSALAGSTILALLFLIFHRLSTKIPVNLAQPRVD